MYYGAFVPRDILVMGQALHREHDRRLAPWKRASKQIRVPIP